MASGGMLTSPSQSRWGVCAYMAAGVAWVMRAVDTTPVACPARSAMAARLRTSLPLDPAQSPTSTSLLTPMTSLRVLTPVTIATAVGAESATWASWV